MILALLLLQLVWAETTIFEPSAAAIGLFESTLRPRNTGTRVSTTFDPHAGHNHPTWVEPTGSSSIGDSTGSTGSIGTGAESTTEKISPADSATTIATTTATNVQPTRTETSVLNVATVNGVQAVAANAALYWAMFVCNV